MILRATRVAGRSCLCFSSRDPAFCPDHHRAGAIGHASRIFFAGDLAGSGENPLAMSIWLDAATMRRRSLQKGCGTGLRSPPGRKIAERAVKSVPVCGAHRPCGQPYNATFCCEGSRRAGLARVGQHAVAGFRRNALRLNAA